MSKYGLSCCLFQQEMTLVEHMQILLAMEIPQSSDWLFIMPHCALWPQASLGNVTWADEDLKNHALHFVSKLVIFIICNYVASTALSGIAFAF